MRSALLLLLLVLVYVLGSRGLAKAATYTWVGGSGNWATASNWSPARVPGQLVVSAATPGRVVNLSGLVLIKSLQLTNYGLVLQSGATLQMTGDFKSSLGELTLSTNSTLMAFNIGLIDPPNQLSHSKMISSRIVAQGVFTLNTKLFCIGDNSISAAGGFQWQKTIYISAGSASVPNCTVNETLVITGNTGGMMLQTWANPAAHAYGYVSIVGSLQADSGSLYSLYMMSPASTGTVLELVTYTSIDPHSKVTTLVSSTYVNNFASQCLADTIWSKFAPSESSHTESPNAGWINSGGGTTGPGYDIVEGERLTPHIIIRDLETAAGCNTPNALAVVVGGCSAKGGNLIECPASYQLIGGACKPVCSNDCSGRGTCVVSSAAKDATPSCSCPEGYVGFDCSIPACTALNNCNGIHGTCVATSAAPQCACAAGWSGADCSVPICSCDANQYCETAGATPTCNCKAGWQGSDCSTPTTGVSTCPSNCNGNHGTCNALTGQCACTNMWMGRDCSLPRCSNDCSLHGTCNSATHTCECVAGWSGADCSTAECIGCVNGACAITASTPQCVCKPGWYGVNCTDESVVSSAKSSGSSGLDLRGKVLLIVSVVIVVAIVAGAALYMMRDRFRCLTHTSEDDSKDYMLQ